ncbi:glycerophosphocholine phosphodiesterase GPCPD1-like isoform X1 [Mytilus californianus]|uniref:glycerophosphocholine phosphodiesterase GPCPD1-like isoform X1 n=1 Tax=Mytilus californianus TaxID=6549 RepID=UPI0022463648|nr:glycerophosphocholine phosphodiesterase GPCPD1-like isoform X1 [Mytilus californianus]
MQMSVTFEVTFCVRADTHPGETVCIIGDCDMLGNWNPHRAVKLTRVSSPRTSRKTDSNDKSSPNGMNIWKRKVRLTNGMHDYKYRYFIARIVESDSEDCETTVDVSKWETNIRQRVFSPRAYMDEPAKYENTIDIFGEYGQKRYVTNGWLIDKTEIHIRLHSNPLYMWKPRHRTQTYSIKCTPLDHRFRDTIDEDEEDDYQPHTMPPQTFTKVFVSTLKNEKEKPRAQDSHGEIYCHNDFMIFSARTIDPEYLGFQFDFYVQTPDKEPKHVGYSYLLPMEMKHSNDTKNLPITGLKHKPIGQIKVDYLFIKPLVGLPMTMEVSYQNYWKFERAALDIGHKGMGSSYKHKKSDAIRENTITSLQSAGSHGADFVEFDVMLSKDLIPVIYHDFHVLITYRKKKRDELENFKISVKDLSLADLHSMQLSSAEHKREDHDSDPKYEDQLDPFDLQPFPTLERCFDAVDEHVGFNVEVKYPMEQLDGTFEEINFFDRNKYVDTILRCVFQNAKSRRIVFSSFDPDTCVLLRLKQNKYPVLFLTSGESLLPNDYSDPRASKASMSINFVNFADLLGIDIDSKFILKHPELIKDIKKSGQVLFCWGEGNNDSNVINQLRQSGVDGIIYDRWMVHEDLSELWIISDDKQIIGIDRFKGTKENVFKIEKRLKNSLVLQPVNGEVNVEEIMNGSASLSESDFSEPNT